MHKKGPIFASGVPGTKLDRPMRRRTAWPKPEAWPCPPLSLKNQSIAAAPPSKDLAVGMRQSDKKAYSEAAGSTGGDIL